MNAGTLTIEIAANVARLTKDMDDAKKAVSGAMADVQSSVAAAKSVLVGLVGIGSIAAFKGMILSGIEAKSRLYDLSIQTGMTVEALGALSKVGKLSNTSIEDVAAASNKLSKALFTQTEDSAGAASAIRALGINFNQFKQLAPEQQMLTVARAMDGFRDGAGKAGAAMELFGKTGATLLPFFKELAEKTDLTSQQTTVAAKQAKDFEDNLIKLKTASEQWKREIVNGVLPGLTLLTQQMVDAKTAGEKFRAVLGNIADNAGFSALDRQRKDLENLNLQVGTTASKFDTLLRIQNALPNAMRGLTEGSIAAQRKRLEELTAAAAKASEALKGNANVLTGVGGEGPLDSRHFPPKPELTSAAAGGTAAAKARDDYTPLVKLINEKIAADEAEFASVTKLTEGQKMQAKFFADVDGGYLKLTLDQKLNVDGMLQEVLAIEKKNHAKEAEARWIKEATDANAQYIESQMQVRDQLQQQARDARLQLDLYGLTSDELKVLESARLRESAALLRQKQALAELDGFMPEVARLYRDQADAIMATAEARDALAARESFASTDSLSGADRAVKEYLDRVKRAGDETYGAVANSLKGLEDLTLTALSGSDSRNATRAWVNGIIAEAERLYIIKPLLASIFGGAGGLQGWLGTLGAQSNGSYNANYSNEGLNYPPPVQLATGTDFVPYDGMLARLHRGEKVTPAAFNPAAGGRGAGGLNVVIENHGADVRQQVETGPGGEQQLRVIVRQAVEQAKREITADIGSGTGMVTGALKSRGVPMGNGSIRRT